MKGRNRFDLYQEQRNHAGHFPHPGHVVGIFLVRVIQPHDFLNFISMKREEDPKTSLRRAKSFFG